MNKAVVIIIINIIVSLFYLILQNNSKNTMLTFMNVDGVAFLRFYFGVNPQEDFFLLTTAD